MEVDFLNSMQIGSKMDTKKLVSSLVEAEIAPKQSSLDSRKTKNEAEISGLGTLKSTIQTLQSAFQQLDDDREFNFSSVLSADNTIIRAEVGSGVATAGVTIAEERSFEDTVNDASIKLKILKALLDKDETLFADVSTIVMEGRVLVTGEVPNDADRSIATSIVWSVSGVKEVLNELQVSDKNTLASSSGDSWISAKLRARLVQDLDIKHVNYTVDTVNKIVYVMGIAQNQSELDRVVLHARDISGVRKIISHAVMKKNR